ncbi:Hypothetical Protein FCC1311_105272 [Hondaea fermentalgiana]|uniref:Uncharacterized protein n=1 Tax=Hondaea fermentalgiana TaxID=2315210 RepID=A0A2R5H1S0_9STRA|nr:Hypothetical Protein FCC1311_105272 [Hondaea fermentalgiana]|eukprot:GBG34304.1 Hypothetical Protein FCC1311_105272 [Hondaea fermentalgiana]
MLLGLDDCSPRGLELPTWHELKTDTDLHVQLRTWIHSVQQHKAQQYIILFEALMSRFHAANKGIDRSKTCERSHENQLEYIACCEEAWRLFLSIEARRSHIFERVFHLVLENVVKDTKHNIFWTLIPELQRAILGLLWAASTHSIASVKLARETDVVENLTQILAELVRAGSLKRVSDRVCYLLGTLACLIRDPAACEGFSAAALTKFVQSLFDVVRKSQEYELPVYMDCTGRILCHVLINDHAFRRHKAFQDNTVSALVASLRFADRIVSEPYFLCVSMILLNFTVKSNFCREFLTTGQFSSFLNSLQYVVAVLTHQERFSKFSGAAGATHWADLETPEEETGHDTAFFARLPTSKSIASIAVTSREKKEENSSAACAEDIAHETLLEGLSDTDCADDSSLDEMEDDEENDDDQQEEALGGREKDPDAWLILPAERVDDILALCLRILRVDFLQKILRAENSDEEDATPAAATGAQGLSAACTPRVSDLLDRIQAVAIAILTCMLRTTAGCLRLLETREFSHFVRDLARMLSNDSRKNMQRVTFTSGSGAEYLLQGKATITSAWNLVQLLTHIGVTSKYAFQHCRDNITDAADQGICKNDLKRHADVALFSRNLVLTLGLDHLAEHVMTVGSLVEDEAEDGPDDEELTGVVSQAQSTKSLFREKVRHVVRDQRAKGFREAAHRLNAGEDTDVDAVGRRADELKSQQPGEDQPAKTVAVPNMGLFSFGAAQTFLRRVAAATKSTYDVRLVVVKMCTLVSACALIREPQDTLVLRRFVDLAGLLVLKGEAYTAMWLLARNATSNRALGHVGAVESALRDLALCAEMRPAVITRILLFLWAMLYQTSNLCIFAQSGGFQLIYRLAQSSIAQEKSRDAQHHGYLCLQIIRVCAFFAADSAKLSADLLEKSGALLTDCLRWACSDRLSSRTRCTAASLLLQMPLPDFAAEKTAVALIRCFMNEPDPTFRIYAGHIFAYIQFSAKGHKLLRKVRIPSRFLSVAAQVCDEIEKTPVNERVCSCPYGTRRSKLGNRCHKCIMDAEVSAALVALLHLSNNPQNQVVLCRDGLHTTLRMAWVFESQQNRALVKSLLSRWAAHPSNRLQLYELELRARQAMAFHFEERGHLGVAPSASNKSWGKGKKQQRVDLESLLNRDKQAFLQWWLRLKHNDTSSDTRPSKSSQNGPESTDDDASSESEASREADRRSENFVFEHLAGLGMEEASLSGKSHQAKAGASNKSVGGGGQFLQAMRESRSKLWLQGKQKSSKRRHAASDPWNPQVASVRSDGNSRTITLKNQFPHDRLLFRNNRTSTMPLTRQERDMMGMCKLSLFPHVEGAVVYLRMNIKPHLIIGPDGANDGEVFLFKMGGSQISIRESSTDLEEVFGLPRPPVSLFDGDMCALTFENPAYRSLEVSQLVDFELLPKKVQAPHPGKLKQVDEELSQGTNFPLLIQKKKPVRKLRSMSIRKIKSMLSLAKRSSLQIFLNVEEETLFHTRKLESDSRSLFSCVAESAERAFAKDWAALMQRNGFKSYIQSIAVRDSTDKGKMDANVPAMLLKIQGFLRSNYAVVCAVYRFYSAASMVRGPAICQTPPDELSRRPIEPKLLDCIQFEALMQFVKDAGILSRVPTSFLSKEGMKRLAGNIFARGIQKKDLTRAQRLCMKKSKTYNFGRTRAMHRFSFLEFVVRAADAKYFKEDVSTTNKSMVLALSRFFHDNLAPLLEAETSIDSDNYRRTRLYKVRINDVLQENESLLQQLFNMHAGSSRDTRAWGGLSGRRMTLPEWFSVVNSLGVISPWLTLREVAFIFKQSIFEVEDVAQDWERAVTLSYTGFLEAFCRLADAMYMPTEAMLANMHIPDIASFYRFIGRLGMWDALFAAGTHSVRECVNDFSMLGRWTSFSSSSVVQLHFKLTKLIELATLQSSPTAELFTEARFWLMHVSESGDWTDEDQFERRVAAQIYDRIKADFSEIDEEEKSAAAQGADEGSEKDEGGDVIDNFISADPSNQLRCLQAARLPCDLLRQTFQQKCDDDLLLRNFLDYVGSADFFQHLIKNIGDKYTLANVCPLDTAVSVTIETYLSVVTVWDD